MDQQNAPQLGKLIEVPCSACGGKMTYSAKKQALYCENCGNTKPLPAENDMVVERSFSEALSSEKTDKGLGIQARQFNCKNCGASSMVDPKNPTLVCDFCGSKNVNEEAFNENLITPAALIPFSIPREKAAEAFKVWIGSGWFIPNNLAMLARPEKFIGIYIPFWTYDAHTDSSWTAEAGKYYYETETYTENGETKTRQVQRTKWYYVSGYFQHWFDDVLVVASKGVSQLRAESIYPYDLSKLINYDPQYLLGWKSEVYALDVQKGFEQADKIMDNLIEDKIVAQIRSGGADTYRGLNINTHKYNITFKHILLPLWIAAYIYNGKSYQVVVNGQTGKVAGEKPIAWWKVILTVIIVVGIIIGLYMIFGKK